MSSLLALIAGRMLPKVPMSNFIFRPITDPGRSSGQPTIRPEARCRP